MELKLAISYWLHEFHERYNKILKHLQKTIWLIFIAAHWKYESKHFVAIFENTGLWNIGVLGMFAFLNQV